MARYATSEETRTALIQAAGELFAEYGVDGVSTRAIAERAGENTGSIHYHFGSKEGLHIEVLRHATRRFRDDPLGRYLDEHDFPAATPTEQARLVAGFVGHHFDIIGSPGEPPWCVPLMFDTMQWPSDARVWMRRELMDPIQAAHIRLFHMVHPAAPRQTAQIWAMNRTAEAIFYAVFEPAIFDYLAIASYSPGFLAEVRRQLQQSALLTLGLPSEELTA